MVGLIFRLEDFFIGNPRELDQCENDKRRIQNLKLYHNFFDLFEFLGSNKKFRVIICSKYPNCSQQILSYFNIPYHYLLITKNKTLWIEESLALLQTPKEHTLSFSSNSTDLKESNSYDLVSVFCAWNYYEKMELLKKESCLFLNEPKEIFAILNHYLHESVIRSLLFSPNISSATIKNVPLSQLRNINLAIGHKGVFQFYYLFKYYPTRYASIPLLDNQLRTFIWNFKDGKVSEQAAKLVAIALDQLLGDRLNSIGRYNVVFGIVPASTAIKNESRYRSFCDLVASFLSIVNGFEMIKIISDRKSLKGTHNTDKISNLNFDMSLISNKYILLFDDVITTGSSLEQVGTKLITLGAKQVTGIFLSKTENYQGIT